MKLKEFFEKYRINVTDFASKTKIARSSLTHYMAGTRNCSQRNAEKIEFESDGLVTVKEMRKGVDMREYEE